MEHDILTDRITSNIYDVYNEAYFGVSETLSEIEDLLDELIKAIKENPLADYTNSELNFNIQKLLKKQFGFKEVYITWKRKPFVGFCSFCSADIGVLHKDIVEIDKKRGYYDKSHSHVCFIICNQRIVNKIGLTSKELLSIILHEIGHNFDSSPYMFFTILSGILKPILASKTIKGITTAVTLSNSGKDMMNTIDSMVEKIVDSFSFTKSIASYMYNIFSFLSRCVETIVSIPGFLISPFLTIISPITHLLTSPSRKSEQFADNFVSTYGYSPHLVSSLAKVSTYNVKNIDSDNCILKIKNDLIMAQRYIASFIAAAGHGTDDARIRSSLDYLKKELISSEYPKEMKKEIMNNINELEEAYNKYLNSDNCNKLVITSFYRKLLNKLFKGRTDYIAKLLPDINIQLYESGKYDFSNIYYENKSDKDENFIEMEKAFNILKIQNNDAVSLRTLGDCLSNITKKEIFVHTIKPNDNNQECFVMSVYPDESTVDMIVNQILDGEQSSIVSKIWRGCKKWDIEIDTRIFDNEFDLSDKELTALILHEVGHIMMSDNVITKLNLIMRLELAKLDIGRLNIFKKTNLSRILHLPVLNICKTNKYSAELKKEIFADKFSIKCGYAKDLASAMDKIISSEGSSKQSLDKETQELTNFGMDSLLNLMQRRNSKHLERDLSILMKNNESGIIKKCVNSIFNLFKGNPNGSVTESVKHDYLFGKIDKILEESYKERYTTEAFFGLIKKRLKKLDPSDIDYIALEINDIKSNDDKMMIISYIYSKIDIIDYYLSIIESKDKSYIVPHNKEFLISLKKRLIEYKDIAMKKSLPQINYDININYPSGYEG